eukprot:TRINITY_DN3676_c0_g2_i1.p1 TRINITY_DN3676_c0_g2~~TRINITY_DN3676_c0_g2_i1.p1  ORF type:complete len:727 (+),score=146.86 TRINITY_DN3676_c0_g2_i1:2-2182(+)
MYLLDRTRVISTRCKGGSKAFVPTTHYAQARRISSGPSWGKKLTEKKEGGSVEETKDGRSWEEKMLNYFGFGKNIEQEKPEEKENIADVVKTEGTTTEEIKKDGETSQTVEVKSEPVVETSAKESVVVPPVGSPKMVLASGKYMLFIDQTPQTPVTITAGTPPVVTAASATPVTTPAATSTTTSAATPATTPATPAAPVSLGPDGEPYKPKILPFPPTSDWPWDLSLLAVASVVILIYSYFSVTDQKLDAMADDIRWGGESTQLACFKKMNFWFRFERFGIKVSNKFLQYGLVEEILGVFTTPRSELVREEASKLLCKLSVNGPAVKALLDLGALDILRNHADNNHIFVLYTLANMSQYEVAVDKIFEDPVLVEKMLESLAFSVERQSFEDRYSQRCLMRFLENVFYHPRGMALMAPYAEKIDSALVHTGYATDPLVMLHQSNIFLFLSQKKGKAEAGAEGYDYKLVGSMLTPDFISSLAQLEKRQSPKHLELALGTLSVGGLAYFYSKIYQRYWLLVDYKPLKVPQKFWSKVATIKSVPMAMALFLLNQGMIAWTESASDDLLEYKKIQEKKKADMARLEAESGFGVPEVAPQFPDELFQDRKSIEHVFPEFLLKKVSKKWGWHIGEDCRSVPFLTSLQLSRVPLYFFALQAAPFALIPSLLPWNTNTYVPPGWQLQIIAWFRYFQEVWGYTPTPVDPTPNQIERVFHHDQEKVRPVLNIRPTWL